MLVKYTITKSVQNDEFDELDEVLQCHLHTRIDDEIEVVELIDEKYLYDILDE